MSENKKSVVKVETKKGEGLTDMQIIQAIAVKYLPVVNSFEDRYLAKVVYQSVVKSVENVKKATGNVGKYEIMLDVASNDYTIAKDAYNKLHNVFKDFMKGYCKNYSEVDNFIKSIRIVIDKQNVANKKGNEDIHRNIKGYEKMDLVYNRIFDIALDEGFVKVVEDENGKKVYKIA